MKKTLTFLLLIAMTATLTACNSNTKTNSTTSSEIGNTLPPFPEKTTTEKVEAQNFAYSKVVFEILNSKVSIDIDQALNDQLEQSKTIAEPTLDDSMNEIGTIWVKYQGSDELIKFGTIYSDGSDNMYIKALENKNNGVLLIEENPESNAYNNLFK